MSKLEDLCPIVLDLSKASRKERSDVLLMCSGSGDIHWWGGQGVIDCENALEWLLRGNCLKLSLEDDQEGFTCSHASITYFEENPDCYNQMVGVEYFKFLLEDHLYEKQVRGGGAPK